MTTSIDLEYHKQLEKAVSDLEDQVSTLRGAYNKVSERCLLLSNERYQKINTGTFPNSGGIGVYVCGQACAGKSTIIKIISDALETAGLSNNITKLYLDDISYSDMRKRIETLRIKGTEIAIVEKVIR